MKIRNSVFFLSFLYAGCLVCTTQGLSYRTVSVGALRITDNAKRYIQQVLDTNRLSYGPFIQKLEHDFALIHDCKYAQMSNSGTSSLQIALQALKEIYGWDDGDEVIVPAVTFIATSNIVLHNRMKPIFVDVDQDYYELDAALIEAKITPRTRAIIPVHLFGQPCDMDPIIAIAQKYGLKIIEDSCETMFARYKGHSVGNLGDIGCFSTYIAHLLTTGIGGLTTTNNAEYAVKMRSLMNHGRDAIYISIDDDNNHNNNEKMKEIIAKRFAFVSVGHSFRVTEMEGALGVAQLETKDDMVQKRQKNAAYLSRHLSRYASRLQTPKIRPEADHVFMMYPLVLLHEPKKQMVAFLEKYGIETRDMLPLICQPLYKKMFGIEIGDYPVADWINSNGFYIGCHQELTQEDLDHIIDVIHAYFTTQADETLTQRRSFAMHDAEQFSCCI